MKRFLFLMVLAIGGLQAQSQDIFAPMKTAIKAGNAGQLGGQLNETVRVDLNGKEASYSKAQAEMLLRDFFRDNPPTDFSVVHTGSSQDGALQFAIGKYVSGKTTFTVLLRVRSVGKTRLIHDISFVKE
jgi:hypothetical protein